ncbi:2-polyprenyl-6-methoxyphenol hydroxylase-like FAD-dependent oxidoreductase [Bradyrhizobium sp. USDA 4510]
MIAEKSATKPIVACETEVIEADVAIVGAGLAGSLARAVLARAGYRVVLIDKRSIPPDEFRVEKIAGRQIDILRRLGFIDDIEAIAAPYDRVINIRGGKLVDIGVGRSYGISYANLVNMARGLTPDASSLLLDQVTNVSCSEERQQLTLASGKRVVSRLVVLATGMANVLGHSLGMRRQMLAARHSVSFGFTIARPDNAPFDFDALTCYGEQAADGVDYLSLFPMSGGMRANLFMFRDPTDPIMRELRRDTRRTLLRLMPGLQPYLGDFEVVGQVQNWVMDLTVTEGHLQPGVVLIGDAFQTNCPAAGTGVGRLLVDVETSLHGLCAALAEDRRYGRGQDCAVLFRSGQARRGSALAAPGELPPGLDVEHRCALELAAEAALPAPHDHTPGGPDSSGMGDARARRAPLIGLPAPGGASACRSRCGPA